jgi:hypothetical protein
MPASQSIRPLFGTPFVSNARDRDFSAYTPYPTLRFVSIATAVARLP